MQTETAHDVGEAFITGFESRTPAERWDQGVVAGTGSSGAVLHGGPGRYVLDLSHEEFFGEVNDRPSAPVTADVLADVRARLLTGEADAAADLADAVVHAGDIGDRLVWTDPLVPAARLTWTPAGAAGYDDGREVSFDSGEMTVRWTSDDGAGSIAVLPLRHADVFLVTLTCDGPLDGVLTFGLNPERPEGRRVVPALAPRAQTCVDHRVLAVEVSPRGTFTDNVARTVLVPGDGVSLETEMTESEIRARVTATSSTVVLAVAVDVPGERSRPDDGRSRCERVLADVDAARARQEADHGQAFRRTSLRLDGADAVPELGTLADRVAAGDPAARRAAVELAFAAGRHTILASTGGLPPTLQGVWQGTWTPAWSSDYTMNGNVQNGAAAGGVVTGLDDVVPAVFRLLARHEHDYVENARNVYGVKGWLLPARCTTHGKADHTNRKYPHHWWVGNGPWMIRLGYDHWSATGDDDFLRRALWPLVEQVLTFSCDVVVPGEDGRSHVAPSYSPENVPGGSTTPLAVDATSDVAMLRDACRLGLRVADAVGDADLDRRERWARLAGSLPDYRVRDGALAEWIGDGFADQVAHRHASHLYPLWYEDDDRFGPAERAAALEAIRRRLAWRAEEPTGPPGRMEMAFGLVQLGVAAARLGAADEALQCASWLAEKHWGTNGVSTHDAGAIFNVDASGGLPALVAAMLLEAQPNTVTLLPACPDDWPSGAIIGLRGRGGLVVDCLEWTPDTVSASLRFAAGTARTRDGDTLRIAVGASSAVQAVTLGEAAQTMRFRRS